jgi:ElaB/YqjD/DUF883 family membrane-anchored ribosome-binding protein
MDKSQEMQQPSGHAEDLRSRMNATLDSAKTAISQADSAALQAIRNVASSAKNVASSADDYVRDNPWVAIGVIAGVAASMGFLAGYMAAPQRSLMGMLRR